MNHRLKTTSLLITALTLAACSGGNTSRRLNFTHGRTVPEDFIKITAFSPQEIEFLIRVKFRGNRLYHLILDQEQNRLAEGWFPATRIDPNEYIARLQAKPGVTFVPGVRYRLCAGRENPDSTSRYHTAYQCLIDYEFTLPEKK